MNAANCLAYCIEFKDNLPSGDKRTARNILNEISRKARTMVNSIDEAAAVTGAEKWAKATLAV